MKPAPRFYPRARDAFGAFLDAAASHGPRRRVLLPAYIGWSSREGSGVFDPIQERGLKTAFYRVGRGLTVDIGHLCAILRAGGPSILVAIHYFGRPDPILGAMIAAARRHDALILEDAAHAYFSAECRGSCGDRGDAAIYSVHKMFPVRKGGLLQANAAWLEASLPPKKPARPPWARVLPADSRALAAARIRRYEMLAAGLKSLRPALAPLWRRLPKGTVPQTLPLLVTGDTLRDKLYFGLKEKGFAVASLYHTLIPQLREKEFPVSFETSRRIFNLPLDVSMTRKRLLRLLAHLRALARE